MKSNSRKFFSLFILVLSIWISGQNINLKTLESEIIKNNREGKYKVSQKKLSEILLKDNLTLSEKGNVLRDVSRPHRL